VPTLVIALFLMPPLIYSQLSDYVNEIPPSNDQLTSTGDAQQQADEIVRYPTGSDQANI